ncbi:sigma-70 family RNA polymerase sigma factor [Mumia sp. zg.B53]|uniref:sigma-70 family RNA polymerase sigma factor n=1 Tax=unclassified Mumia TaxID=2621872 RepID=UPI001C6EF66B|nr:MULTISPECIES: sigma-70 family RNA polymerase sigma factor [unclassified Mumia]MBW9206388.1 sigma-70 family RNA polymerase sigma factor [Mumia sp. zg.B17]MBW9215897.1 sigma-70 family RNA polymerase sigma factor [Mumia sp. zg.B53]
MPPAPVPLRLDPVRALTCTPLLSAEDERRLAEACAAGRRAAARLTSLEDPPGDRVALEETVDIGLRARSHLVLANMRLVVALARSHQHRGVPLGDLVQEGTLGLIAAVDRFDPSHGTRFSTYAVAWVRRHVSDGMSTRRAVRLPPRAERDAVSCREAAEALVHEAGRVPAPAAIAARTGLAVSVVERLMAADAPVVSLDAAGLDVAVVGGAASRDLTAEAAVREALRTLPEGDREVVERRFGLDGGGPRTARAVADELGRTTAWVRATERRVLRALRTHPAVSGLGG